MRTTEKTMTASARKLKKISTLVERRRPVSVATCQGAVSARPEIHRRYSRLHQLAVAGLQPLALCASRFRPGL
jgi:hypothetical protein